MRGYSWVDIFRKILYPPWSRIHSPTLTNAWNSHPQWAAERSTGSAPTYDWFALKLCELLLLTSVLELTTVLEYLMLQEGLVNVKRILHAFHRAPLNLKFSPLFHLAENYCFYTNFSFCLLRWNFSPNLIQLVGILRLPSLTWGVMHTINTGVSFLKSNQ